MAETKEQTRMEKFKTQLDDLKNKFRDYEGRTKAHIEEHPFQTTLIGFGVGLLAGIGLGFLLRRK